MVNKINVNGQEFELAGNGGGSSTPMKMVVHRAIKRHSKAGMVYFFQTGMPVFSADDSTYKSAFTAKYFGDDRFGGTKIGAVYAFRIPDDWEANPLVDEIFSTANVAVSPFKVEFSDEVLEYIESCAVCRDGREATCATTSPNFIIEGGRIRCVKRGDADKFTGFLREVPKARLNESEGAFNRRRFYKEYLQGYRIESYQTLDRHYNGTNYRNKRTKWVKRYIDETGSCRIFDGKEVRLYPLGRGGRKSDNYLAFAPYKRGGVASELCAVRRK